MKIVIPAILVKSRVELDAALARLALLPAVENVQIDIVDGVFAKPPTWPYALNEEWELPLAERFRFDIDLMVQNPGETLGRWVELGASRITLHAESTTVLPRLIADFKQHYGHEAGFISGALALGVAIGMETDIATLEPVIDDIDYVQFMGIAHIGKQGEPFDPRVFRKIQALRKRHSTMTIQVDGGVSRNTAAELLDAGVDRLVVGSALLKAPNIEAELAAFEVLGERHGIFE